MLGRVVHVDFVKEQLETKKKVNFGDSQEQTNGIELAVMADTIHVKVCLTILYLILVNATIGSWGAYQLFFASSSYRAFWT